MFGFGVLFLVIGILGIARDLCAEDGIFKGYTFNSPKVVEKTVKGITFKVPADWPVEERNGEVAPIPVEEYVAGKLGGLEARLQALEQRFNGLDLRLRILEQGGVQPSSSEAGLRSVFSAREGVRIALDELEPTVAGTARTAPVIEAPKSG